MTIDAELSHPETVIVRLVVNLTLVELDAVLADMLRPGSSRSTERLSVLCATVLHHFEPARGESPP